MGNRNKKRKVALKLNSRLLYKKWFIISFAIVVFLFGLCVGWLYTYNLNNKKSISLDTAASQEVKKADALTKIKDDAQMVLSNGGDVKTAVAIYDDAIKSSKDASSKKTLLLSKATMYFNNNNLDEALVYAIEAESISKDQNIEQFIAQIYEGKGDNQNASKYYQSAIQFVDKSAPMANEDIDYYQSKVNELTGGKS